MALPQIQQARIIQAPGVFDYAMREGPRLAEAFTAGLSAGSRMREGKQAVKDREAARSDRLIERNQGLVEKFGPDAVVDPESGTVDVTASSAAAKTRADLAMLAKQAGEAEALGEVISDLPPEARQLPEYKAGLASGLAKVRLEETMLDRIDAREKAMLERQKEIERIQQEGLKEIERIQQEGLNQRQKESDQAAFLRTILGGGRSSTAAPRPSIRVTEGPTGTSINRTFQTEDELRAFQAAEAARRGPVETGDDPEFEAAALEAIKQYETLRGRGIDADLDFKNGIPKVTPSSFWDTATPEKIEALRRKVNPKGAKRSGVPLGELTR